MAAFDLPSILAYLQQQDAPAEPESAFDPSQVAAMMGPNTDSQDYGSILSDLQNQLQGLQPHRSFVQRAGMALANSPTPQFQPSSGNSWLQNFLGGAAQTAVPAVAQAAVQPMQEEDARMATVRAAAASLAGHRWDALKQRQTAKAAMVQRLLAAKKPVPPKPELTPEQKGDAAGRELAARNKALTAQGQRIPGDSNPAGNDFDPADVAAKIQRGDAPADSRGYSRGQWGQIVSKLPKGYNLSKATMEFYGAQRLATTLNGRQFTQLRNSASAVDEGMSSLEAMVGQLEKLVPTSSAKILNSLSMGATKDWGAYGPEAQALAQQITTQVADMVPELANVFSAGGVPSDKAMAQAHQALDAAMSPNRIRASIKTTRQNIGYRLNAIRLVEPMNPMEPNNGMGGGNVVRWGKDAKGNPVRLP